LIGMEFGGMTKVATDIAGNLVLSSSAGDVVMHKPLAYQMKDGQRVPVEVAFALKGSHQVALNLGEYDHERELVIDPSLTYASYLGGSGEDEAYAVAVSAAGSAYVTGETKSPTFGGLTNPSTTFFSVFVSEVNSAGTGLVYTSLFGASSGDSAGNAIAVDAAGNAYVGGGAALGFPTTTGQSFGGGNNDGFVLKVNAAGLSVFSTYLGGSSSDVINGIAVDGASPANVYVAGETQSTDFPTVSAIQQSNTSNGLTGFVSKLNGTGATLGYSTYLGGSNVSVATGIALDSASNAYVAGLTDASDFPTTSGVVQTKLAGAENGFVTEVKSDGSAWTYSTYLGGNGTDDALGIAVDAAGEAYVAGSTTSTNFPTANAAQAALGATSATNAFVSKLSAGGTTLLFSTYYGGEKEDDATAIALDSFADAYVTGRTTSSKFPVSGSPFQSSLSGSSDAFVTEFSNTGFVVYSSYLGGTGTENDSQGGLDTNGPTGAVAVDSTSNTYLAGSTASTTSFPAGAGVFQPNYAGGLADGFVAKVAAAPADFSVAASPSSVSATSGQSSGAVTVTVSSVNSAFGQAVALSCGNLPADAVCNFSTGSVTPGNTAQTSTLTIATSGASSVMFSTIGGDRGAFVALLLPVFGITLISVGVRPKGNRLVGFLVLGFILTALMTLPACGGSSGGGGGGVSGTTPGTYNFTVIGTAGSSSHSAPITLTVH
jgi:beta-propeller repeat-containing protein